MSKLIKVVSYKGKFFLHYRNNSSGLAQLVNSEGKKVSGTPHPDKLQTVKTLRAKLFNGHYYVATKQGIFSCSTGMKISDPKIVGMFK